MLSKKKVNHKAKGMKKMEKLNSILMKELRECKVENKKLKNQNEKLIDENVKLKSSQDPQIITNPHENILNPPNHEVKNTDKP